MMGRTSALAVGSSVEMRGVAQSTRFLPSGGSASGRSLEDFTALWLVEMVAVRIQA